MQEFIWTQNSVHRTHFCFSTTVWSGTNVWLPKMDGTPLDVDFESVKSSVKSAFWNNRSLHCDTVFPARQYCPYPLAQWMYDINLTNRLSQALLHFVIALAKLFTDHKMSGLPLRAKKINVGTICECTSGSSPTVSSSSFRSWWSSRHGVQTLNSWRSSCSISRIFFRRISSSVLPCRRMTKQCHWGMAPSLAVVLPYLLRLRIQTIFDFSQRSFF